MRQPQDRSSDRRASTSPSRRRRPPCPSRPPPASRCAGRNRCAAATGGCAAGMCSRNHAPSFSISGTSRVLAFSHRPIHPVIWRCKKALGTAEPAKADLFVSRRHEGRRACRSDFSDRLRRKVSGLACGSSAGSGWRFLMTTPLRRSITKKRRADDRPVLAQQRSRAAPARNASHKPRQHPVLARHVVRRGRQRSERRAPHDPFLASPKRSR